MLLAPPCYTIHMNRKQSLILVIFISISLISSFTGGFFFHEFLENKDREFPVLMEAHNLLVRNGFNEIPEAPELEYGMIRGMLNAYGDPFTIFLEPPQHELQTNNLQGSFGGIGVQLTRDDEYYVILHPFTTGPALQAGVLDGDRLVRVDDLLITSDVSLDVVVASLRGPENQIVEIGISRPPENTEMSFEIIRVNIGLPSVTWFLSSDEPRLGVVDINLIAASTPDEIENAVADLENRGATHFILDLRGNGGGLLDAGIDVARLFLEEGVVIEQQYQGESVETYEVSRPGALAEIPIVVLIDANTASSAEIIAGALQANGRASLLGSLTYGKDSIQLIFELQDGSSLHVTSARWWFPDLEFPTQFGGLLADIEIVPDGSEVDPGIYAAIQYFFGDS
ncbi:MAG: PDZ domain-containing protein [Chloroflexi bacterium]|nr:PDZ domain-containing protein [Chloroflexota bacterium]